MKFVFALIFALLANSSTWLRAQDVSRDDVLAAMRKATNYFRTEVASHGGYVYYYSLDLSRRQGEGTATREQIWVQPPGTPAVGLTYLKAFKATGDRFYLEAAREAADALVYGQLRSGGWTNAIDFDPSGSRVAQYRNGKGKGRNFSSLDDGITQSALRFLMNVDQALGFKDKDIHAAARFALDALLDAQFPSGGFPQGWDAPVKGNKPQRATYPDYEWRTENRIKNYWDMPTLNDGLAGTTTTTLIDAWQIYKDDRARKAIARLGDFLLLAQMPEPQPAWAQQYDKQMRPIWARKFEPPAIAGRESEDALKTLLKIHEATGDKKYLEPIPKALAYLKRCRLPDGRLARFYELKTNKPLYMTAKYELTYDDASVPTHYGWKTKSHLEAIEAAFENAKTAAPASPPKVKSAEEIQRIIAALDDKGRWVSTYSKQALVGQPKFGGGERFLSSEVFSENLEALCEYVATAR